MTFHELIALGFWVLVLCYVLTVTIDGILNLFYKSKRSVRIEFPEK